MKFPVSFLVVSFIVISLGGIANAQEKTESSDPYFQPKGTLVPKSTPPKTTESGQFSNKQTPNINRFDNGGSGFVPQRTQAPQDELKAPTASTIRSNFQPAKQTAPASQATTTIDNQFNTKPANALTSHSSPFTSPKAQPDSSPRALQAIRPGTTRTSLPFEPTRVLARVGGQPIFVSDLSVEAMQIVDKYIPTAPAPVKQEEVKKILPRLLPKYIQAKLLLVDALEGLPEGADVGGIYDSAGEQFDEGMLLKLMKNIKVNSPAELDAYYRALGSSLRKVRLSWIESELVKYTMRTKINVNPDVSHREMYEHYLANKEKYAVPAKANWEQLAVRYDQFPSHDAAKAAMAVMGDEVVHGAPLDAVAKRSSQGFKASQGGQQGWTTRGSLVDKKLDELLFNIEVGKLSAMVPTRTGMAIIRVNERQEAGFVSFETSQSEIKEKLLSGKQDAEFQKHIDMVKARVPVEVFDPAFVAERPGGSSTR